MAAAIQIPVDIEIDIDIQLQVLIDPHFQFRIQVHSLIQSGRQDQQSHKVQVRFPVSIRRPMKIYALFEIEIGALLHDRT